MPNFRLFDEQTQRMGKKPFISLQTRGIMSMNGAAFALLGSPKEVEFFYDEDEQIIGIRRVTADVRHARLVRKQNESDTYVVSAKAFCDAFGIDTSVSKRFAPVQYEDNIIGLHLRDGIAIKTPRSTHGSYQAGDDGEDVEREPEAEQRPLPALAGVR